MSDFEAAIFLVDKPAGPTSFDMVRQVRRLIGVKKVGHAGTLDPFASGLLVICAGRSATKLISLLMEGTKEYLATIVLGIETTTQDPEGEIVAKNEIGTLSEKTIKDCLQSFVGLQYQTPPQFSALKYKGKPLYFYARQGIEIQKEPRQIQIELLERVDEGGTTLVGCGSELKIRVVCSKGTYIRSLAADIGTKLGCGAYLGALRRTRSGIFSVENGFSGKNFREANALEQFLAGALSVNDVCNLLQKS